MSISKGERRTRSDSVRVLVVDDEADIRELLDLTLARMGVAADCAGTVAEAKKFLAQAQYKLCLTDMRLPDGEGLEIVRLIGAQYAQTPVAVITAFGSTDNAVAALKAGAFDYLAKPVALDPLRALIKSALKLPQPDANLPAASAHEIRLIGESSAIMQVKTMIAKLARSQAPVYISGESGSGKELGARLIHLQSARQAAPFVPVNCGAIPENLMESEFFGYRKGAFTGADSEREGFFQAANGGTLFLDEVADLPLAMQVKLLRAIQEKRVRKVGNTTEEPVDVRIVSATHKNLKACVDAGTFRQDLYYRLNIIELRMPTLRERPEDIPRLIEAALNRLCAGQPPAIAPAAMRILTGYSYPGNVRELENILERATALCVDETIQPEDLQLSGASTTAQHRQTDCEEHSSVTLDEHLERLEKQKILEAMEKTASNPVASASLLGISNRSLHYRLKRLGLEAKLI